MSRGLTIALVASVLVLALGVAGLASYVFLRPAATSAADPTPAEPAPKATAKGEPLAFLKLKNFVTDLADRDRLRYVDVTVALGLETEAAVEEAKKVEPQIRDLILSNLRSKKAEDLAGAAGKDRLAEELTQELGEVLHDLLKRVYVTDLVVQ